MMSNLERLVYMANQIARNFEAIGHDAAAAATADHIASFWDPRMKAQIFALMDCPGHVGYREGVTARLRRRPGPPSSTPPTRPGTPTPADAEPPCAPAVHGEHGRRAACPFTR